jgi:hypothetical protein
MADTYLAQDLAISLIELAKEDLRDLQNPRLSPFYEARAIPPNEFDDALAAANASRTSAGLSELTTQQFASQVIESSRFFTDFLAAAGLETSITDDLTQDTQNPLLSVPGVNATFAAKYRDKINLSSSTIASRVGPAIFVQHIDDAADLEVADSDSIVRERVRNIHGYLGAYLFT